MLLGTFKIDPTAMSLLMSLVVNPVPQKWHRARHWLIVLTIYDICMYILCAPNVLQKRKETTWARKHWINQCPNAPLNPKALALAQILAMLPSSVLGLSLTRVRTNQLMKKRENIGQSKWNSENERKSWNIRGKLWKFSQSEYFRLMFAGNSMITSDFHVKNRRFPTVDTILNLGFPTDWQV